MMKLNGLSIGRSALIAVSALTAVAAASAQAVFVRGFEGTSQLDNCALGQCFRPPSAFFIGGRAITMFGANISRQAVAEFNRP